MAGMFGNFSDDPRMQRQMLQNKYNAARINLLAVVIFSAINLIALATNSGTYFLFTANLPYMLTFYGMFLCGKFPEEYYKDFEGMVYMKDSLFVALLVISVLILVIYLLCWLFSKNGKAHWLKVAIGLFGFDTLLMLLLGSGGSMILDLVFHVWILFILSSGIKSQKQLGELPKEEVMIETDFVDLGSSEEDDKEKICDCSLLSSAEEQQDTPEEMSQNSADFD